MAKFLDRTVMVALLAALLGALLTGFVHSPAEARAQSASGMRQTPGVRTPSRPAPTKTPATAKTPAAAKPNGAAPAANENKSPVSKPVAELGPWKLEDGVRPHADGPVTAEDFAAEPPAERTGPYSAWIETQVRYRFTTYWEARDGQVQMRVQEVQTLALVDRNRSWALDTSDDVIRDHEQGHFDITAIHALQLEKRFRQLVAAGQMKVVAETSEAAAALLNEKMRAEFDKQMERWREQQVDYDRLTVHGVETRQQDEQRRQHRELLEVLRREKQKP